MKECELIKIGKLRCIKEPQENDIIIAKFTIYHNRTHAEIYIEDLFFAKGYTLRETEGNYFIVKENSK